MKRKFGKTLKFLKFYENDCRMTWEAEYVQCWTVVGHKIEFKTLRMAWETNKFKVVRYYHVTYELQSESTLY